MAEVASDDLGFRMPSLGADMEAGTLVEWKVKAGDRVKRGDVVAVVETDKGAIDIEIWRDGQVEALVVPPGSKVPVGTVLATLAAPSQVDFEKAARPLGPPNQVDFGRVAASPGGRVRASPAARQRAREIGVALTAVAGSGPGGAVTRDDVEKAVARGAAAVEKAAARGAAAVGAPPPPAAAAAAAPQSQAAPAAPPPPTPTARPQGPAAAPVPAAPGPAEARTAAGGPAVEIRRAIAAAMARSKREIPHYYLATDIDMAAALAWLAAENARLPVPERMLPALLLVRAVARAVAAVPEMNGFFENGAFRPCAGVHVGMGIALRGGGLIAPALHDAERKPLPTLMRDLGDLIRRARGGHLRSSELSDATITVTSMGDRGVETVYGVIYPPQVALVGFGRIAERPRAVDGLLGVRPVVTATLAADHRVSDGHRGGLFLEAVAKALAAPETLR